MKKNLLLFAFFMMGTYGFSQVLYSENFSSGALTGWSGNALGVFNVSQTQKAGGEIPEARISNTIVFFTTQQLISPTINTSGYQVALLSFKQKFEFDNSSTKPFTFNVLARKNAMDSWHKVDSLKYSANKTDTYSIYLTESFLNSPDFQFCIEITGRKAQLIEWCLDDIQLLGLAGTDVALTKLNLLDKVYTDLSVSGTLRNVQGTTINSLKVNWKLIDNITHTTLISDLHLTSGNYLKFTCDDVIPFKVGGNQLTVWVSDVNGIADDDNSNDQLEKSYSMSNLSTKRHPMFEVFTGSMCSPCAPYAEVLHTWAPPYGDNITFLKYQYNAPMADPYFTQEAADRGVFYTVLGAPTTYCDGVKLPVPHNTTTLQPAYDASCVKEAAVKLTARHTVDGTVVTTVCTIEPLRENLGEAKLMVAILERMTVENIGSNGQTEFYDVMMKMVPNVLGTPVSISIVEPQTFTFVTDIKNTFVEEMDDLRVLMFIQKSNKEILNSAYSVGEPVFIQTNIKNDDYNILLNTNFTATYSAPIRKAGGLEITNANVASLITLENLTQHEMVPFDATISADKKTITVTPKALLEKDKRFAVRIKSLETNNLVSTQSLNIRFLTGINETEGATSLQKIEVNVFPNPVSSNSMIEYQGLSNVKKITLLNALGKTIHEYNTLISNKIELPKNLSQGVYFLKFETADKFATTRIVVIN